MKRTGHDLAAPCARLTAVTERAFRRARDRCARVSLPRAHKKFRSLSIWCPGNKPKKNLMIVKTQPTDTYGASSLCTKNYAETDLPGPQFNFQTQHLALRSQAENGFLWKVSSFVRQKGSSLGSERPSHPAALKGESCH